MSSLDWNSRGLGEGLGGWEKRKDGSNIVFGHGQRCTERAALKFEGASAVRTPLSTQVRIAEVILFVLWPGGSGRARTPERSDQRHF